MISKRVFAAATIAVCLAWTATVFAAGGDPAEAEYRDFLGLNPRMVVWFLAELHLMFGAFVLGVPIFAVLIEYVGTRSSNPRFDELAHECTRLLSAAYATTAALGGLMSFALFSLYPKVMQHISGAMHNSFYVYGLLFFGEAFTLYLYYYSWDRMRSKEPVRPALARVLKWPAVALAVVVVPLSFYLFFLNSEPAHESQVAFQDRLELKRELDAEAAAAAAAAEQGETKPTAQPAAGAAAATAEQGEGKPAAQPTAGAEAAEEEEQWTLDDLDDGVHPMYYLFAWLGLAFMLVYGVYAWAAGRKSLHIYLGVMLNLWGTALMLVANSWASYMMSPSGIDPETSEFVGTTWQAVSNPLWRPLSLHRLLGNISFGGFVVGAYAAVKFLYARSPSDRAHYDWMGYVGNFVGLGGLLLLPFAGYYLGREIYSYSPVMGNDMMGGFFSWTFILQAVFVGFLFIGANYYLWAGMDRIDGAERFRWMVKFILGGLVLSFLVWVTPHNLPVKPGEQSLFGSQFHPVLKYLGLMPAKNAAVNFILLSTFFSFMLYRRANKGALVKFSEQGGRGRVAVLVSLAASLALVGWYTYEIFALDPAELSLEAEREGIMDFHAWLMVLHMAVMVVAVVLLFRDRGKLGQALLVGVTAAIVTGVFGVSGYVVLQKANPFLRNLAMAQTLMVLACMILTTAIDLSLFRGAREIGKIRWGEIGTRPQYALLLLCLSIVMTMGLMGYVRAGLRQEWHVYGVLQDTSENAATPLLSEMATMVGLITAVFLGLVAFVFWLGTFSHKRAAALPLRARDEEDGE